MKPWVICSEGGNFSGKSTQMPRLADALRTRYGIDHNFLDTRELIEEKVYDGEIDDSAPIVLAGGKETTVAAERYNLENGIANTTEWVADHVVIPEIIPRLREGTWLFFPGSPRVQYEGKRFAEVLTDLAQNDVIGGCLVVYIATPKEVCFDRARRWYASLDDPDEQARMAYKIEKFDDRWEWYENLTKPTFEIMESASGLYVPRVTVKDDGTRSIEHIHQEILWKATRAMGLSAE